MSEVLVSVFFISQSICKSQLFSIGLLISLKTLMIEVVNVQRMKETKEDRVIGEKLLMQQLYRYLKRNQQAKHVHT